MVIVGKDLAHGALEALLGSGGRVVASHVPDRSTGSSNSSKRSGKHIGEDVFAKFTAYKADQQRNAAGQKRVQNHPFQIHAKSAKFTHLSESNL